MNRVRGKTFGFAPRIPIFFKTGWSFLPNRLKAALDCQTSITRQPPGIGPAMCTSTPLTGQSRNKVVRDQSLAAVGVKRWAKSSRTLGVIAWREGFCSAASGTSSLTYTAS
jgi:hypothetical protein